MPPGVELTLERETTLLDNLNYPEVRSANSDLYASTVTLTSVCSEGSTLTDPFAGLGLSSLSD